MPSVKNYSELEKLLKTKPETESIQFDYSDNSPLLAEFKQLKEVNLREPRPDFVELLLTNQSIKKVSISKNTYLPSFPEVLTTIPWLEILKLNQVTWDGDEWNGLEKMTQIKSLELVWCPNQEDLPEQVYELGQLTSLSLNWYKGDQFSLDIAQIFRLSKLEKLNLTGQKNYDPVLLKLPMLKELTCSCSFFNKVPECILDFEDLDELILDGKKKDGLKVTHRFYSHAKKKGIYDELRLLFKGVFTEEYPLAKAKNGELILLLNCGVKAIAGQALLEIEKRIETKEFYQKGNLQKGLSICVLGKTHAKLKDLKSRLEEVDGTISSRKTKKTSFYLIGTDPGIDVDTESYPFTSERLLQEWIDEQTQPYLLEEASAVDLAQISRLLLSHDATNIKLAQQMMEGGGMPPDFLTECFLIFKSDLPKKVRDWAKQYIERHGSPELLKVYSRRKGLNRSYVEDEKVLIKNLDFYLKNTGLDVLKVLLYFEQYYPDYNWIYYALRTLSAADKKVYLDELLKNGVLEWTNFLKKLPPELAARKQQIHTLKLKVTFPLEFPEYIFDLDEIQELEIFHYGDIRLPDNILKQFPRLKRLKVLKRTTGVPDAAALKKAGCRVEYF